MTEFESLLQEALYGYHVKPGTSLIDMFIMSIERNYLDFDFSDPKVQEIAKRIFGKIPTPEQISGMFRQSNQDGELKRLLVNKIGIGKPPNLNLTGFDKDFNGFEDQVEEIASVGVYTAYRLHTVEAVKQGSQRTYWGLSDPKLAQHYLGRGPLIIIYKDGKKFAMHHHEQGTHSTKDEPLTKPTKDLARLLDQFPKPSP